MRGLPCFKSFIHQRQNSIPKVDGLLDECMELHGSLNWIYILVIIRFECILMTFQKQLSGLMKAIANSS